METCPVYSFCSFKGMHSICTYTSPWNSPRQSAVAEGFAEANSVITVITSAKVLPR